MCDINSMTKELAPNDGISSFERAVDQVSQKEIFYIVQSDGRRLPWDFETKEEAQRSLNEINEPRNSPFTYKIRSEFEEQEAV